MDAGDPVNWAPHWAADQVQHPDPGAGLKPGTNVIVLPSVGDSNVPISTGIALARAAGLVGYLDDDGRYGSKSQMEVLVDKGVVEGLFNRCRYTLTVKTSAGAPVDECLLYDIDDLDGARLSGPCDTCEYTYSDGSISGWVCVDKDGNACGDGFGSPFDLPEPLRATFLPGGKAASCSEQADDGTCRVFKDSAGVGAMRITLTLPQGFHGLYLQAPYKQFDIETYIMNVIGRYFMTSGTEVWDDPCLEDSSCEWMPAPP
jgi:hypothetical protein